MMVALWVALAILMLPIAIATAFLLGRQWQRRQAQTAELSPVTRQHIQLFQGGQINDAVLQSAKARLGELLQRGQVEAVEASLRPGMGFVVQVRALAEIGTEDAGKILERQLQRRLTNDPMEQSWYWIDLASSLRILNRAQSLPHLLRCAEEAGDVPLGHFLAAETVCFLGFSGYLRQPESALGKAALRVLHRALLGLRSGVQPQVVAEARLGEAIEILWDHRPDRIQPLIVRVFQEALRQIRRSAHALHILAEEKADQEAYNWQLSRLVSLEPMLEDYLNEAPLCLGQRLATASSADQVDILAALTDLRAEAAPMLLPLLADPAFAHVDRAVEALTWSSQAQVGARLRDWASRHVPMQRRVRAPAWPGLLHGQRVPKGFPYASILRALRGHPSAETEGFLLLATADWDAEYRCVAISSLGWWEPFQRAKVIRRLQQARNDPMQEVRQAARAALARLGERQSLQWFRQALHSEDAAQVHEAIQLIAQEGVYFLWTDLDHLADAADPDLAFHAREALEHLHEGMARICT